MVKTAARFLGIFAAAGAALAFAAASPSSSRGTSAATDESPTDRVILDTGHVIDCRVQRIDEDCVVVRAAGGLAVIPRAKVVYIQQIRPGQYTWNEVLHEMEAMAARQEAEASQAAHAPAPAGTSAETPAPAPAPAPGLSPATGSLVETLRRFYALPPDQRAAHATDILSPISANPASTIADALGTLPVEALPAAAAALKTLGDRSVVDRIRPLLANENVDIRAAAVDAFIGLGARADYLTASHDASPTIRMKILEHVLANGEEADFRGVAHLLTDGDAGVRTRARSGFQDAAERIDRDALTGFALSEFESADDATMQIELSILLGNLGGEAALTALTGKFGSALVDVQRTIVTAIGKFETPGGRRAIAEILENSGRAAEPGIVAHAATIAGRLRAREAVPHLIDLLDDEDSRVRQDVLTALMAITGHREARSTREAWSNWWDDHGQDQGAPGEEEQP